MPRYWHASRWFLRDALCLHHYEGAWHNNTGNGYFGGLQWLPSTWLRAGGRYDVSFNHPGDRRYAFTASPREEIYRMWLTYLKDGRSFHEWGTAARCGLR